MNTTHPIVKFHDIIDPFRRSHMVATMTGGGKTGVLVHLAARAFLDGKQVIFITCELSRNEILNRLAISAGDSKTKSEFESSVIVESCGVGEFTPNALNRLLVNLIPGETMKDAVVFIDYFDICNLSSYTAEDLCAVARVNNVNLVVGKRWSRVPSPQDYAVMSRFESYSIVSSITGKVPMTKQILTSPSNSPHSSRTIQVEFDTSVWQLRLVAGPSLEYVEIPTK